LQALSRCLQTVVEARLILGEACRHMERAFVRHRDDYIPCVADLTQVPLHRVAKINGDV
jgi:uncharacterized protein (UPF0248 family)